MKQNAQRILCWLYPAPSPTASGRFPVPPAAALLRWVDSRELAILVPNLTEGGLLSTLSYLQQRQRVVLERVAGRLMVSITTHGMRVLEERVPAFSPARRQWDGRWQALLFLTAPKTDPQFRALRRVLLAVHAVPLTRGVFLYPGVLPEKVIFMLQKQYEAAVIVAEWSEWTFGDEQQTIGSILRINDLAHSYSSVSRDIDTLLKKHSSKIGLNNQSKLALFSVFDRLYAILQDDHGLGRYYFPQVENGVDLLFRLQNWQPTPRSS